MRSGLAEKRSHAQDANVTITAEAPEVSIAGNDAVGARRQHMIVIRVAARGLDRRNVDDR